MKHVKIRYTLSTSAEAPAATIDACTTKADPPTALLARHRITAAR